MTRTPGKGSAPGHMQDAALPAPSVPSVKDEPDPASLHLVAEILALLRSPPLPPRATLERVKVLLTVARAVAEVDASDREAAAGLDPLLRAGTHESVAATRGSAGPRRSDIIRDAQLKREAVPQSIGSRLALDKPPPNNELSVKVLNEKRCGVLRSEDAARDFRF